jgi:8-amino-7-oxononanoate synthase
LSDIWPRWAAEQTAAIRSAGQWRQNQDLDLLGPAGFADGEPVVSFASNDYLGLTSHPAVVAAAHAALDRWGTGSGSARLIVGSRPGHSELETDLAEWKGCERALLFSTGFSANLGVLSVFGGADVTVFSDALNHASIIDGCKLGRSRVVVYRHNDLDHLAALLAAASGRKVVVTDSVFSMDGDLASVNNLAALCLDAGALLVLDEAHGVLGPDLATDLIGPTVLRMGTLSKALGSLGGFVAGSTAMIDLLVNRARSFIFTTASSPADVAAAHAALAICRSDEGERLRARLRRTIDRVRPGHPSPIVPIVLGGEQAALDASAMLRKVGLIVPAIRPPTVAPGSSRLRIALSAAHTDDMIDRLVAALREGLAQ